MTRNIVILTKSTMRGDYCIAGIDRDSGEWIRLVSDNNGSPLLAIHRTYQNAQGECQPLDVVSVELPERVPHENQTENMRLMAGTMQKLGTASIEEVVELHPPENHEYIFGNVSASISPEEMQSYSFNYSLIFIKVRNLDVHYRPRNSRADFDYNNVHYNGISITDPEYTSDEGYSVWQGDAYLVMSMPTRPDRRNERYYKFIAKIFPLQ